MTDAMEIEDPRRPESIFLQGVDNLSTDDIKKYVKQHTEEFFKVEWINDTSLNLVFEEETHAGELLKSLAKDQEETLDDLSERVAKPYDESNPDIVFTIRMSRMDDKKVKNAATYSRYYLFNPKSERREPHHSGGYRDRDSRRSRRRSIADDEDLFPEKVTYETRPRRSRETNAQVSEDLLSGIRPEFTSSDLMDEIKEPNKTDTDDLMERIDNDSETEEVMKTSGSLFGRIG